jgi:hypothetical protein
MANGPDASRKGEQTEKNVKCSFCGNDTFCEQCKAEPGKTASFEHMCHECHQRMGGVVPENVKDKTHICIPPEKLQENFERFMSEMTYRAFTELWEAEKKKLKEMSRQELAQSAFFEGASFMWHFVQRMQQPPAPPPESGSENPEPGSGKPASGKENQ